MASANQLGDYPEAWFATPGHVYGPDGVRVSRSTGAASVGGLNPEVPGRWRVFYGDTLLDEHEDIGAGGEPLEICS